MTLLQPNIPPFTTSHPSSDVDIDHRVSLLIQPRRILRNTQPQTQRLPNATSSYQAVSSQSMNKSARVNVLLTDELL